MHRTTEDALSPLARAAFKQLRENGRIRTEDNLGRLAMIELKAFGLATDPFEDVWVLNKPPLQ